jgi:hypothetical protein
MNIGAAYIHQHYISRFLRRLIKKYNIYSSVIKLCSSFPTAPTFPVILVRLHDGSWWHAKNSWFFTLATRLLVLVSIQQPNKDLTAAVGMRKPSYRLFTVWGIVLVWTCILLIALHIQAPTCSTATWFRWLNKVAPWVRDWSNCQCLRATWVRDWSKRVVCTTQRTSACIRAVQRTQRDSRALNVCAWV